MVALSECATHAIVDAGVWPQDFDERAAGLRLLRGVEEGVLLLWDRGFHGFEMVRAALARGSELLGRLPSTVKPEVRQHSPMVHNWSTYGPPNTGAARKESGSWCA